MFSTLRDSISNTLVAGTTAGFLLIISAGLTIPVSSTLADTSVSASSTRPGAKRSDADVDEWFYTSPGPADIITWTSGVNWADRSRFPHANRTEAKFAFPGGVPAGRALTGFLDNDGPGILGSTATSAGGGFSALVPGRLWAFPTCNWSNAVGGALGTGQGAYWHAKAAGLDPYHFTATDFEDAGITEDIYDFYVVAGFDAGTEISPNGRFELNVWYDTAGASVNLLRVIADADNANVVAAEAPGLSLYVMDTLEDGPDGITGSPISTDEIAALLRDDMLIDRTLDTPLYIGVLWDDIPVPTVDMGDGVVARCRVETGARDRDALEGNPFHRLPWFDDIDVYEGGQGLINQSSWDAFDNNPAFDAVVNPMLALSPPNSIDVQPQTNVVHLFDDVDEGLYIFRTFVFVPFDFQSQGSDPLAGSHLMLFDDYAPGGPFHVATQIQFDSNDQQLKAYCGDASKPISVPYIVDQWVPIEVVVDLEADMTQVFYDSQPLCEYTWTAGAFGDGQGAPRIAAVDLFARGSTSIFYDDLVLEALDPPCPADVNGSGVVDVLDLLAVLAAWGGIGGAEDVNGDGIVDILDLLAVLGSWGPC